MARNWLKRLLSEAREALQEWIDTPLESIIILLFVFVCLTILAAIVTDGPR